MLRIHGDTDSLLAALKAGGTAHPAAASAAARNGLNRLQRKGG
jgi:hypothetical protein